MKVEYPIELNEVNFLDDIDVIMNYLTLAIYIMIFTLVISTIYSLIEWFSKDRVIKLFEGKKVLIFLGREAYCGKLYIPPRSGGGFEVFFESNRIENPHALLAFLLENYNETGDRKFLEEAKKIMSELKRQNVLPQDLELEDIEINPWSPPSLVSRKVYSNELNDLYAIIRFRDLLTEEERKHIWKELRKLYHPSILSRLKRKIYNALAYIKDRLSTTVTTATAPLTAAIPIASTMPEFKKAIEDAQKKALAGLGSLYDPLLENSIGRLVAVKVKDVDGEEKMYQGILREYSNNYISVYDVDYRLQVKALYQGTEILEGYPMPVYKAYGVVFGYKKHIKIESIVTSNGKTSITFKNISGSIVKLEKAKINSLESSISTLLKPEQSISVMFEGEIKNPIIELEYEISREADIIWPRSKVKVIGLGDYPPTILETILTTI